MRSWLRDIYIIALGAVALALIIRSIPDLPTTLHGWAIIGLFAVMVALADVFPIVMPGDLGEVTVSTAILIASVILFGPAQTIFISLLGTLMGELGYRIAILKRPWNRVPFNVAQAVTSYALASMVYLLAADATPHLLNSPRNFAALILAGLTYYATTELCVSMVISLDQGFPILTVWKITSRDAATHNLTMIPLGGILALLWSVGSWTIILAFLPLLIVRRSMGLVRESLEQTRKALIALADTIDARDSSTYHHSQRVAEYAGMIARQMGLPYDQVDLLVTSARLHDLGKIGMGNELLYKPGSLSEEERSQFQRHPSIGEALVGYFPAFGAGRDIVRHHHERFNGRGYPNGKKGGEIPLGARVLAVADAYDAMTSDRPYRPALSKDKAIAELKANSGTQFDPQVVQAFLTALEEKEREKQAVKEAPRPRLSEVSSKIGEG